MIKKLKASKVLLPAILLSGLLITITGVVTCKRYTESCVKKRLFSNLDKIPANEFGLVLGTSKMLHGKENLYYKYRMRMAAELYRKGKIKYFLVSGARKDKFNYDEPTDMKRSLIELGIPENVIFKDNAGFRTLDSIIRAKQVFGLDKFTIISQNYHNSRAVYIGRYYNLDVIAADAQDTDIPEYKYPNHLREYLAKVKMMLDLYLLATKPIVSSEESCYFNLSRTVHKKRPLQRSVTTL
ncbi:MAG: ElyC/SanA/YdcF family protein [Victivallaceae bacterium]